MQLIWEDIPGFFRFFQGLYRYRYGSYRIIYAIDRRSVVILILRIGDRKDVYEDQIEGASHVS